MKTNTPPSKNPARTHEGGRAQKTSAIEELERAVCCCLLWEDQFYEKGEHISERIAELVHKCDPNSVADITIKAKFAMKLRHVPLLLAVELCRHPERKKLNYEETGMGNVGLKYVIYNVIQRPDELGEFVSIYWKQNGGRCSLASQVKKGLSMAFNKFDTYQFSKWDRNATIRIRDVMKMVHPKPVDDEHRNIFNTLWNKEAKFPVPDTWETRLSSGEDKRKVFEDLLSRNKLPGMACLMNLRNMLQSGVNTSLIRERLEEGVRKALPFRFVTAARYAPQLEDSLEKGMFKSIEGREKLPGFTCLLVDVSGSMSDRLSSRSELSRRDAASALAILLRELCPEIEIATFANGLSMVPNRRGFALRDAIAQQPSGGTYLAHSLKAAQSNSDVGIRLRVGFPSIHVNGDFHRWKYADRLIVITDEQSHDGNWEGWAPYSYMINVASFKNGVGYGNGWTHINGWSEAIVDFIQTFENGIPESDR